MHLKWTVYLFSVESTHFRSVTHKQLPSYTHIQWQGQQIISPPWPCLFASLSFKTPHEKTKISNNTKTHLINDTSLTTALCFFLSALFSKEILPVIWLSFLHLLPLLTPTLFGSHYSLRFFSKKVIQSDYTSVWMSVAAHTFVLVGLMEGMWAP